MTNLEASKKKIADTVFMERTFIGTLVMTALLLLTPSLATASKQFVVNNWRSYCVNKIMNTRMQHNPDYLKPVILKEVKEYCG